MMKPASLLLGLVVTASALISCSDEPAAPTSLVPANYRSLTTEVRGCRNTIDHNASASSGAAVSNIRVRINLAAAALYQANAAALPVGTLVIKEEFDDPNCTNLTAFTVMHKEPAGYDPTHGDWRWQRVRASDNALLEDGVVRRCWSCHNTPACVARDWQCTEP